MSQIQIEFDNTLKQSEIIVPLISSSMDEEGSLYGKNETDIEETSVFGIMVPLIAINSTVIDFDSVISFNLSSEGILPELNMIVEDRYELINNIDKPGVDNEVRVQILPKFDNAYKKIDLTFYVTNIKVNGSVIKLMCTYKSSKLMSSKFESLGMIDTYSLFKYVALNSNLGFATNISEGSDLRYAYCDNKSWLELMKDEIHYSGKDKQILDWWIDFWNNINLADIYERYNAIDKDEDMLIWISGQTKDVTIGTKIEPIQIPATIHNHPGNANTEMYYKDYTVVSNPGSNITRGSDKVYSIYIENNDEYLDYLIQDGDVKEDIYLKYEYLGESYGDYNYLLQKQIRLGFLQKIGTECIKVSMTTPVLGLMRGQRVNVVRYTNDDMLENKMTALEDAGVLNRNVESNIPLKQYELEESSGKFTVDKTASAQYYINGVSINYTNNEWSYILSLVRPGDIKPEILKKED